jgi:hypothetical protein
METTLIIADFTLPGRPTNGRRACPARRDEAVVSCAHDPTRTHDLCRAPLDHHRSAGQPGLSSLLLSLNVITLSGSLRLRR